MKLRALDLFCGRGGASIGLNAAGFDCVGVDIEDQPHYPFEFHQADALDYPLDGFDFYWASSPCPEFSVWNLRCFHPNPAHPHEGIRLFKTTRARLESTGKPYVMENVYGAQYFVGPAVARLGPFHLWGTCVPAIWPRELRRLSKGMKLGSKDGVRETGGARMFSSHSKERKEASAMLAMIPRQLAEYIGKQAIQYLHLEGWNVSSRERG